MIRTAAYAAVTLVLLSVNLFGLDHATREYSAVLFNLVFGPSYATAEYNSKKEVSKCERAAAKENPPCGAAVIHFTDQALTERLSTNWPVSYLDHATLLSQLLKGEPRAVVVDILFLDHRPEDPIGPLREQVAAYNEVGVPLYFAALSDTPLAEGLTRPAQDCSTPELAGRTDCLPGEPVPSDNILWVDVGDGAMDAGARSRGGTYFISYPPLVGGDGGRRESPAFKVYNDLTLPAGGDSLPANPVLEDAPLRVFWNGRPHAITASWYRCDAVRGLVARLFYALTNVDGLAQACPSLPTAKAAFFFGKNAPQDRYWMASAEAEQEEAAKKEEYKIDRFAKGRVVYYGANLPALGDQIVVPAVGALPGVWAHAMAHDNLLRFGQDYKRSVTEIFDITIDAQTIEFGLAIGFIVLAIAYFEWWRHRNSLSHAAAGQSPPLQSPENSEEAKADLWLLAQYPLFVILFFFALILVTWLCFHWLNVYPINWIQLMGLLSVIGAIVWQRPVERILNDCVLILKGNEAQPAADGGDTLNDGGRAATTKGN